MKPANKSLNYEDIKKSGCTHPGKGQQLGERSDWVNGPVHARACVVCLNKVTRSTILPNVQQHIDIESNSLRLEERGEVRKR